MPASIHPPLHLTVVLDERSYRADGGRMARRFAAVAPAEVVRADKGSQRANVLRFDVGGDAATSGIDLGPLGKDAVASWLDEAFAEASALVARENDARRRNGEPPVRLAWVEVRFGTEPVIAVRMRDSAIPAEAAGFVARARALLLAGAFGPDPVAAIRMPACASIAAQRADADRKDAAAGDAGGSLEELRAVAREERAASSARDVVRAVEEAAGIGGGQDAWAVGEAARNAPTRSEIDAALAEAEDALRQGDDPTGAAPPSEERPRPSSVAADRDAEACARADEDVPENLDYRVWNVAYADGTSVRYDSVLGEALLD